VIKKNLFTVIKLINMKLINAFYVPELIVLSILMGVLIFLIGKFRRSNFVPRGKGLTEDESTDKLRIQPKAISIFIVISILLIFSIIGYSIFSEKGIEGVFYFITMTLEIVAKWLWDLIKTKEAKTADLYKLILPLLVSPIVFSSVLSLGIGASGLALKLFAFQSGFFWQTVFGEK